MEKNDIIDSNVDESTPFINHNINNNIEIEENHTIIKIQEENITEGVNPDDNNKDESNSNTEDNENENNEIPQTSTISNVMNEILFHNFLFSFFFKSNSIFT